MTVNAEWVLVNVVGNFGVFLILSAYFLLNMNKLQSGSLPYLLINLCGSLCIGVSLFYNFNLPSAVIEVCWTLISLYGLGKLAFVSIVRKKLEHRAESASDTPTTQDDTHEMEKQGDTERHYGTCRTTF